MSYLDEFRPLPPFFETDRTDKTTFKTFRRQLDGSPGAKTAPLPLDQTDKTHSNAQDRHAVGMGPASSQDLNISQRRVIPAHITVVVFDDGSMRIVATNSELNPRFEGINIYRPLEMYCCVTLSPPEHRRLLAKSTFRGTTERKELS